MGLFVTFLTLQILRIPHLARWSILGRVLVVSNFLHMSIMRHASGKLEFYSFFQLEALAQCYTKGRRWFWFLLCDWILCPDVNCTYQQPVINDSDLRFTNLKTQNMFNFETVWQIHWWLVKLIQNRNYCSNNCSLKAFRHESECSINNNNNKAAAFCNKCKKQNMLFTLSKTSIFS